VGVKQTYHGGCHCGAVTFAAEIDLDQGTAKCNCTYCWKQRMWNAGHLADADFRLLRGEDKLADYGKSGDWGEVHHHFCKVCGIATHSRSRFVDMGGEPRVSVHLAALNDLPVDDLVAAPVTFMDGLHDDWGNPPAETRQL
jgi:hypothetical protein